MSAGRYLSIFILLCAAMFASFSQMSSALEDADIPKFSWWTLIATFIASLPSLLW